MFVSKRYFWYLLSLILLAVGIFPVFKYGLSFDVDFAGGSIAQVQFDGKDQITKESIKKALEGLKYNISTVAELNKNEFRIKIKESEETDKDLKTKIFTELKKVGTYSDDHTTFLSIQPLIGMELKNKIITALIIGFIAILLYIWVAFRKGSYLLPSYYWGISAIVALLHDGLITLGLFAYFAHSNGYEFSIPVAAALLTILGKSLNDTIIVFDRVRENLVRTDAKDFGELVDRSIRETVARSINTSLVTLIVIAGLLFFGSPSLVPFTFTLFVAIAIGTFSSLFIASPLLYDFYRLRMRKNE